MDRERSWVIEAASVISALQSSEYSGGFCARGQGSKLLKFAGKIGAPIMSTFRAKGIVDDDEALYVGCHGGLGTTAAADLMNKADLLIAVGSSFSDLSQIPKKRTVQIDINPLICEAVSS